MPEEVRLIGRYALHGELASGGMAAVHLGRLLGPVGFSRTVAIKRLHSHHARDPEFVAMFLDEARLVSRIKHPNVVPTLDVVALDGEIFLVMEYVHGAPVSRLMMALGRRKERMPINIAVGIALGMLEGLHAAHEAKSEEGVPLGIVHRDVSPQNVIVGADGVARVLDFGIAKAAERLQTTEDGSFKGKLGYMPPDVLSGGLVDRRADLWGAAVVLWEMLVGKRLFHGAESPHALVRTIVEGSIVAPSTKREGCSAALDDVVLRGLAKDPNERFQTAREMVVALEDAARPSSNRAIGEWLVGLMADELEQRAVTVEQMERSTRTAPPSLGTVRTFALSDSGAAAIMPAGPPPETPPPASVRTSPSTEVPAESFSGALPIVPGTSKSKIALVVALLLAILTVGVVAVVRITKNPADSLKAAPTSALAGEATAKDSAPATSASSAPPTPPTKASATVSASASASAPAGSTSPPAVRPPTPRPPPRSCNPPYTIGPPPDYIRKPKLECLPR